jgi:hypothetical protein
MASAPSGGPPNGGGGGGGPPDGPLFACGIPGRPLSTNFNMVEPGKKWAMLIERPALVNEFSVRYAIAFHIARIPFHCTQFVVVVDPSLVC